MDDCQEAFETYCRMRYISTTKGKDAWDREIYEHSHVQAAWDGFQAAWEARGKQ